MSRLLTTKVMIAGLLLVSGCAKKSESSSAGAPAAPAPSAAEPDQSKVDVSVADASITNTLAIVAGDGAGTELEVPPNTLPAGTKVEMRVADSAPAAFSAAGESASAAIFMRATDASGADVKPAVAMTVALVIGSGATLTGIDKVDDNLCAALENTAGEHFVWRRGALELAGGKARFKTKAMGIFQLIYCGTTALGGFTEVGATGDTKAAASTILEGTWKSGCIVDQNSKIRFEGLADGLRLSVSLAGLYTLKANETYTIPVDFPQVEFFAESTGGTPNPVSFAATSGTLTIDTIDASGISGTFDGLSSFTNGYNGDPITINFAMLPQNGSSGGTMAFQEGGQLGMHEFGTQNLLDPSVKFDGAAVVRELAFVKNELTLKESLFGDAECKILAHFDIRSYAFAVGEATSVDTKPVTKLDLTVKTIKRTAVAAEVVADANANQGCGLTGWVANVERDITGSTACHAPAAGAVVHQFFGIDGNTLKLGEEKPDGSLPVNYDDEYEYLK